MDTVKKLVGNVSDLIKIAKLDLDAVTKEQSSCDSRIGGFQHVLEIDKLNAIQLAKTAKLLRSELKLRRELKEKKAILQGLIHKLEPIADLDKTLNELVTRSEKRLADYDQQSRELLATI